MKTNRSLDLLGVPDLPIRAFIADASGRIKPQSGGGSSGGGGNTSQTSYQTNIPEYARPYAEEMLGQGQALTDINQNPYQPYTDQRFAAFSPMQAQAFQNVAGQQVAPQLTDASNLAYTGAQQGLQAQGTAGQLQGEALGYGAAGAGYGSAASNLGIAGAKQAQQSAQQAQQQAGQYGQLGSQAGIAGLGFGQQAANYGAQGAQQAGQVAAGAGSRAQDLGMAAQGFGAQGAQQAGQVANQAGLVRVSLGIWRLVLVLKVHSKLNKLHNKRNKLQWVTAPKGHNLVPKV